MFKYLLFLSSLIFCISTYAQEDEKPTPEQQKILDKFEYIKNNTNWDDQNAAAKAFKEMERLTRELDRMNGEPVDTSSLEIRPNERILGDSEAEYVGYEILRIEDEENHFEIMPEVPLLMINLKQPNANSILERLNEFTMLQVLVIIGDEKEIDLTDLFNTLADKPLKELYIAQCGGMATIAENIGNLTQLQKLSLFSNHIQSLPNSLINLKNLELLYLDNNPLKEMPSGIAALTNLKMLGIAQTEIGAGDRIAIQKQLPKCKILNQ